MSICSTARGGFTRINFIRRRTTGTYHSLFSSGETFVHEEWDYSSWTVPDAVRITTADAATHRRTPAIQQVQRWRADTSRRLEFSNLDRILRFFIFRTLFLRLKKIAKVRSAFFLFDLRSCGSNKHVRFLRRHFSAAEIRTSLRRHHPLDWLRICIFMYLSNGFVLFSCQYYLWLYIALRIHICSERSANLCKYICFKFQFRYNKKTFLCFLFTIHIEWV